MEPEKLKEIATTIHVHTKNLAEKLSAQTFPIILNNESYFDTLSIKLNNLDEKALERRALDKLFNFKYHNEGLVGISLDEKTSNAEIEEIASLFTTDSASKNINPEFHTTRGGVTLQHSIFNSIHSETEMLRYIHKLEKRDLSLNHSMIPLGSCTMKLNATVEMIPISWPEFSQIHPFAQTIGYKTIIDQLEMMLYKVTGFDAVSFQPNSGAQGEYAGLLTIQEYHHQHETNRNVCLIPSSAHGTNPASAVMAGMKVVVVKCDDQGNVDVE